jgi:hypothetical protein
MNMKVGDLVRFPTGMSRETKIGVLMRVRDNPADKGTHRLPRQVADIWVEGKKWTAWAVHLEAVAS